MSTASDYRCPRLLKSFLDAVEGDEAFVMCVLIGFANTILVSAHKVFGGDPIITGGEYITGLSLVFGFYSGGKFIGSRLASRNDQ